MKKTVYRCFFFHSSPSTFSQSHRIRFELSMAFNILVDPPPYRRGFNVWRLWPDGGGLKNVFQHVRRGRRDSLTTSFSSSRRSRYHHCDTVRIESLRSDLFSESIRLGKVLEPSTINNRFFFRLLSNQLI